jgi:hypothetical protein
MTSSEVAGGVGGLVIGGRLKLREVAGAAYPPARAGLRFDTEDRMTELDEDEGPRRLREEAAEAAAQRGLGSTSFLTGLALGALVGAACALLFAPATGESTRRIVRRRATDLSRQVADGLGDAHDATRRMLREKKESLRERLARLEE